MSFVALAQMERKTGDCSGIGGRRVNDVERSVA
jgi:hypothetical protein